MESSKVDKLFEFLDGKTVVSVCKEGEIIQRHRGAAKSRMCSRQKGRLGAEKTTIVRL